MIRYDNINKVSLIKLLLTIIVTSNLNCNSWGLFDLLHGSSDSPAGSGNPFKVIAAGYNHTLAIGTDGSLWAWGDNSSGQLGNGTAINSNVPLQIDPGPWKSISAGGLHSLGIKIDGSLWAWGENIDGQLGNGTLIMEYAPILIDPGPWESISAGGHHSAGIKTGGSLFVWGDDLYGQVGDNQACSGGGNCATPKNLPGVWKVVSAGQYHTLGIQSYGSLWAWGDDFSGQIGDSNACSIALTFTYCHHPVQIDAPNTYLSVSAGGLHSMALRSDNSLWGWGDDGFGQLGDNQFCFPCNFPQGVVEPGLWRIVIAGYGHTAAIKSDGSLWTWGMNNNGELGVGPGPDIFYPVNVLPGTQWQTVSAGGDSLFQSDYTMGIQSNGSLWSWGSNLNGQLGLGDFTPRYYPVKIP